MVNFLPALRNVFINTFSYLFGFLNSFSEQIELVTQNDFVTPKGLFITVFALTFVIIPLLYLLPTIIKKETTKSKKSKKSKEN